MSRSQVPKLNLSVRRTDHVAGRSSGREGTLLPGPRVLQPQHAAESGAGDPSGRNGYRIDVLRLRCGDRGELSGCQIPGIHPAEGDWAKCEELPLLREPRRKSPGTGIPEGRPMTGVNDTASIRSERNQTCSSDDHDGSSVAAEPDRSIVPAVRPEKPRRGGLFGSVYAQVSAGDCKCAGVRAKLEIV